jgi:hypothetical protein
MAGIPDSTGQDPSHGSQVTSVPAIRSGRFGRFEILGSLGEGGAGTVYRARDPETKRDLALKVPRGVLSPQRRERFRREGLLTAQLEHSGIVRIHGAGEVDGVPFLAYQLVEGDTFEDALARLDRPARMAVILDVARAMAHAHERGVVHRDLKPANVLIDRDGRARVADFGLALARGLSRMTQSQAMLGTPSHMAPEQFNGGREDVGPATDVWAMGVMLYKALVDEDAFSAGGLAELAGKILTQSPEPPRAIDPTISKAVQAVCLRALSKSTLARQADAGVFAEEFERALLGQTPSSSRRFVLVAVGAMAALAAGVGVALRGPAPTETQRGAVGVVASGGLALAEPSLERHVAAVESISTAPVRPEEKPVDKAWLLEQLVWPPLTAEEGAALDSALKPLAGDYHGLGRLLDPIRRKARPLPKGLERDVRLASYCYLRADNAHGLAKLAEHLVQGELTLRDAGESTQESARVGVRLLMEATSKSLQARRMLGRLYLGQLYRSRGEGFANANGEVLGREERLGAAWYFLGLEPTRRTPEMRAFGAVEFGVPFPLDEDEAWSWVGRPASQATPRR